MGVTLEESRANSRGYTYQVTYSEEDGRWVATVEEFPSLAAHGETEDQAIHELQTVVFGVIFDMMTRGEIVPEPQATYSGVKRQAFKLSAFDGLFDLLKQLWRRDKDSKKGPDTSFKIKTPIPFIGGVTNVFLDVGVSVGVLTFAFLECSWCFLGLKIPTSNVNLAAFDLVRALFSGLVASPFLIPALPFLVVQKAWLSYGLRSGRYVKLEAVFNNSGVGIREFVPVVLTHIDVVNKHMPQEVEELSSAFRNHERYLRSLISDACVRTADVARIEDYLATIKRPTL